MRRLLPLLLISIFAFALSGCYQAQVTTDRAPSGQTIEKNWATGHVFGLITPGADINAADRCPNGVSRVETGLSFPNMVVSAIPFVALFYSPMTVKVTCAEGGSMSSLMPPPDFEVPSDANEVKTADVLQTAALESAKTGEPVRVKMK